MLPYHPGLAGDLGRSLAVVIPGGEHCAGLDKQRSHLYVAGLRGEMKRRAAARAWGVDLGTGLENQLDAGQLVELRADVQRSPAEQVGLENVLAVLDRLRNHERARARAGAPGWTGGAYV